MSGEEKGAAPVAELIGVNGGVVRLPIAVEAKQAPSKREAPSFLVVEMGTEISLTVYAATSNKCCGRR